MMKSKFALLLQKQGKSQALAELQGCNEITVNHGLSLSDIQLEALVERGFQALGDNGRVEFGGGVLKKLILTFCDSPYIMQDTFEETLAALVDAFYFFKGETLEQIADDDLIAMMKEAFDGVCQGSLEYLCGFSLEDLAKNTRFDRELRGILDLWEEL